MMINQQQGSTPSLFNFQNSNVFQSSSSKTSAARAALPTIQFPDFTKIAHHFSEIHLKAGFELNLKSVLHNLFSGPIVERQQEQEEKLSASSELWKNLKALTVPFRASEIGLEVWEYLRSEVKEIILSEEKKRAFNHIQSGASRSSQNAINAARNMLDDFAILTKNNKVGLLNRSDFQLKLDTLKYFHGISVAEVESWILIMLKREL